LDLGLIPAFKSIGLEIKMKMLRKTILGNKIYNLFFFKKSKFIFQFAVEDGNWKQSPRK